MNFDFDIVMILALFTIGAVLIYAIVSRQRASSAQDHHEDAAVARRQRAEDAAVPADEALAEDEADGTSRTWSEERGANPPTPMPPQG